MSRHSAGTVLAGVATFAVALALGVALWTLGSPGTQRDVRLDERRERELQRLETAIESHWEQAKSLPTDLDTLASRPGMQLATQDPVSGTPYGYRITGERSYQLCASFATDSAESARQGRRSADLDWPHGVGAACFDRSVQTRAEARP